MSAKNNRKNRSRKSNKGLAYQDLEQRQLLATLSLNAASGQLNINLDTAGETAVVSTNANGQVVVNNSADLNSSVAGTQSLAATNLNILNVTGASGSIDLNNVDPGVFNATTAGDLNVTADSNLILDQVDVSGDLNATTTGAITDTNGSSIDVDGIGRLVATNVTLGQDTNDSVRFARTSLDVSGDVELHQSSNIILISSQIGGDLIADSEGGVFDGRATTINVGGNATLSGDLRVRVGDHGTDTFNAGTLTIQTEGHAAVHENSSTQLVGNSTARTLDLTSTGALTDSATATLTTEFSTGLFGDSIFLGDGDNAVNTVDLGGLYFFSPGEIDITEQNSITIIDEKNFASRLTLTSLGVDGVSSITDVGNAKTTVQGVAEFFADDVRIGDFEDDEFNAGSIRYVVENEFFFREDSGTNLAGNSSAAESNIGALGDITNRESANLEVSGDARFRGTNILVGNEANDTFNFGRLIFTTNGNAFIAEDSDTEVGGNSTAGDLELDSTGTIVNIEGSSLNVAGRADFGANGNIDIGDRLDDEFNAATVSGDSATGNVNINEDSATVLARTNNANAFSVVSTGSILNAANSTILAATNLSLNAGGAINIGTRTDATTGDDLDRVEFSSVTFNTTGNVAIETQADALIAGSNTGGIVNLSARNLATDELFDIRDAAAADINVTNSLILDGFVVDLDSDNLFIGGSTIDDNGPNVGTFNVG